MCKICLTQCMHSNLKALQYRWRVHLALNIHAEVINSLENSCQRSFWLQQFENSWFVVAFGGGGGFVLFYLSFPLHSTLKQYWHIMKIKTMADGLRLKMGGGSCQGCLQGDRLHYCAIKSLCGNTVLSMCLWPGTVLASQQIREAGSAGWERPREAGQFRWHNAIWCPPRNTSIAVKKITNPRGQLWLLLWSTVNHDLQEN